MRKIIICGAGNRCRNIYPFMRYLLNKGNMEGKEYGKICGFIDINSEIVFFDEYKVWSPDVLDKRTDKDVNSDAVYFITPEREEIILFYKEKLNGKSFVVYEDILSLARLLHISNTEVSREFCAYNHIHGMDKYFAIAEEPFALDTFWSQESMFKQLFDKMDISNVIELACGKGRHVGRYIEKAGHVTLVDILQENIDICRERLKQNEGKISYYKNSGSDLCNLPTESYSALFCYDAMVHFELLDISNYLKDIFRVLQRGGKALLHHSNYDAFYDARYENSKVHGRAFMNYKIFAYLALQAGFSIIRQEIIDWGEGRERTAHLDCITLLEKPL